MLVLLLCSYGSSFQIARTASAAAVRFQVRRELSAAKIEELSDDGTGEAEAEVTTHGYEGNFKVGDVVKVAINTKMYHVKQYSKTGFDPHGFVGRVDSLALYGRKFKTLCSAITPVKVKFSPEDPSIPAGMFDKAWVGHFAGDELELVSRAAE